MEEKDLLEFVKTNLRITTTAYDDSEISRLISSAEADISAACDSKFDAEDMTECQMVVLYVRGMFGAGDDRAWKLYQDRLQAIGIRKVKDVSDE
jgi:hypothetical protein